MKNKSNHDDNYDDSNHDDDGNIANAAYGNDKSMIIIMIRISVMKILITTRHDVNSSTSNDINVSNPFCFCCSKHFNNKQSQVRGTE